MIAVIAVAAAYIGVGLRSASNSLGCDFLAYFTAAQNWLAGRPIYDLAVSATGTCGTYQYPPPFVLVAAPFSLAGFATGTWLWVGFLIGCWAIGTAILPLKILTRWIVLLAGAIGVPLIVGVRIGQVAPILYLVFAYAWRNLDRPLQLGASVAIGALVKLQPALLGVWLLSRRAWRALGVAALVGLTISAAAAVLGLGDWFGLLTLLRSLSDAVTVSANLALGSTLHNLGLDASIAGTIQVINTVAIVLVVVAAGLWLPRTPGFLVAIVCTQLISPILWNHYALLLLLPVAWLLERRQWWAAAIPVAQAWVLVSYMQPWTYTLAFYVTLIAVFVVGWRARTELGTGSSSAAPRSNRVPATAPEPAT